MESTAGTIVVGVDDSEQSMRAVAWAAEQARLEHRELTLVHAIAIVTPAYIDTAAVYPEQARRDLHTGGEQVLAAAADKANEIDPDLVVHRIFEFADPRELLLELSERAAMVVLGSRGRGRLRSLLLGSVGVAVVRHAHCPVVVHRPGVPEAELRGIVVGADGTEESRDVLEFAYREASLRDLPLTVLHCYWDINAATASTYVLPEAGMDLETERMLLAESMSGIADKYPEVVAHTELASGMPQEALVFMGEHMNLIVVGAHRLGRLSRMLFGSVAISVVEHATCPVAVVPVSVPE